MDERTLSDLGERRIIEEILRPRYDIQKSDRFGDDCAVVANVDELRGGVVVATTDPCPEPMASLLGYSDYYYSGWLLATINLSDLAAVGATPLGLLTSLILKNDMTVGQFMRLLDGVDDCCRGSGTRTIGGNLKEGPKVELSATAIGYCKNNMFLSRVGCQVGDLIVVLGDLGLFWAGVLSVRKGLATGDREERLLKNILTPIPKVQLGQEIASKGLLTACLDNSDGLYSSLIQIANANNVKMSLRLENLTYSSDVLFVSSRLDLDPARLSLGWGDWQLIGCCSKSALAELQETVDRHSTDLYVIGEVEEGRGVHLQHGGVSGPMAPIDSQRFTRGSWFTAGIDSYITALTDSPIIQPN